MTAIVDPEPGHHDASPLGALLPVMTRLVREAVDAAATGSLAGPTWRPGTVEVAAGPGDAAIVTLDGTDSGTEVTAPNVSGASLLAGQRVLVMFTTPHGVYITAAIDATAIPPGTPIWNVATSEAQMPGFLAFAQTIPGGDALYPILWDRIPAGWKSGSSIVLPSIAGRAFRAPGGGASASVGGTGGAATVALTAAQSGLPAHTIAAPGNGYYYGAGSGDLQAGGNFGFNLDTSLAVAAQNAAQAHENLGPYIVFHPYLKY